MPKVGSVATAVAADGVWRGLPIDAVPDRHLWSSLRPLGADGQDSSDDAESMTAALTVGPARRAWLL
ncbi:hypothetical protein ACIA8E_27270 [Streptomyces sp. NPDC051664]|uniref:hypothetical protein n=1 Tax=Streptomyces sp. NPDC051664 TaxID=3365668 RepID=UPI0037929E21